MVVLVAWVFFRAPTMSEAWQILTHMFTWHQPATPVLTLLSESPVPVAIGVYIIYAVWIALSRRMAQQTKSALSPVFRWSPALPAVISLYAGVFFATLAFAPSRAEPFIYFQF